MSCGYAMVILLNNANTCNASCSLQRMNRRGSDRHAPAAHIADFTIVVERVTLSKGAGSPLQRWPIELGLHAVIRGHSHLVGIPESSVKLRASSQKGKFAANTSNFCLFCSL
jgi:hypothetical protein